MTSLREAAQAAMEFLDAEFGWSPGEAPRIDALRAALAEPVQEPDLWGAGYEAGYAAGMAERPAEPVQEPVAWRYGALLYHDKLDALEFMRTSNDGYQLEPLYTTPPQRSTAGATYSDVVSDGGMDTR